MVGRVARFGLFLARFWRGRVASIWSFPNCKLSSGLQFAGVVGASVCGRPTRAIAPVAGVTPMTVSRDQQVSHDVTPEPQAVTVASAEGTIIAEQRHVNLDPESSYAPNESLRDHRRRMLTGPARHTHHPTGRCRPMTVTVCSVKIRRRPATQSPGRPSRTSSGHDLAGQTLSTAARLAECSPSVVIQLPSGRRQPIMTRMPWPSSQSIHTASVVWSVSHMAAG